MTLADDETKAEETAGSAVEMMLPISDPIDDEMADRMLEAEAGNSVVVGGTLGSDAAVDRMAEVALPNMDEIGKGTTEIPLVVVEAPMMVGTSVDAPAEDTRVVSVPTEEAPMAEVAELWVAVGEPPDGNKVPAEADSTLVGVGVTGVTTTELIPVD